MVKRLLSLLIFAAPSIAQMITPLPHGATGTSIDPSLYKFPPQTAAQTVQNPSFAANALASGAYNLGPIPNWTITGGVAGMWTPPVTEYPANLGVTLAFSNGGTLTQDLGTLAAGNYNFSVQVGARADGIGQSATYTLSLLAGTTSICSEVGTIASIQKGAFLTLTQPCAIPVGDVVISLGCSSSQCDFTGITLVLATPPPPPPPPLQSINFTFSGTLSWSDPGQPDDGAPIAGTVQVSEWNPPKQAVWNILGTATPDSSGNISGTVSLSTNCADAPTIQFVLSNAAGAQQGVVQQGAPGAMFCSQSAGVVTQTIHGITGFKLIVNKPSCAVACQIAAGTAWGTLN
jgi:hypothetical protein